MASVRQRGKYFYYRVTKSINGKRKYIEHGGFTTYEEAFAAGNREYPLKRKVGHFKVTKDVFEKIFERFPENSSAFIPLHLLFYYNVTLSEAYQISANNVDYKYKLWKVNGKEIYLNDETVRLLRRQELKVLSLQKILLFDNSDNLYNINLKTGRKVQESNIWYVSKVIRKTIDPSFSYKEFRKSNSCFNRR